MRAALSEVARLPDDHPVIRQMSAGASDPLSPGHPDLDEAIKDIALRHGGDVAYAILEVAERAPAILRGIASGDSVRDVLQRWFGDGSNPPDVRPDEGVAYASGHTLASFLGGVTPAGLAEDVDLIRQGWAAMPKTLGIGDPASASATKQQGLQAGSLMALGAAGLIGIADLLKLLPGANRLAGDLPAGPLAPDDVQRLLREVGDAKDAEFLPSYVGILRAETPEDLAENAVDRIFGQQKALMSPLKEFAAALSAGDAGKAQDAARREGGDPQLMAELQAQLENAQYMMRLVRRNVEEQIDHVITRQMQRLEQ